MERWWNVELCVVVPFDTEAEARAAVNMDWEPVLEAVHEMFGGECREIMTGRVVEATDEDDPI